MPIELMVPLPDAWPLDYISGRLLTLCFPESISAQISETRLGISGTLAAADGLSWHTRNRLKHNSRRQKSGFRGV
jgi:hypothetical protein